MNHQYIENCNLIKENKIKSQYGVLDYSELPLELELDRICNFYSETLFLNQDYGINPALFYFENSTSVNAVASKQNNYYVVGIYFGTIVHLAEVFSNKNDLIVGSGMYEYLEFEGKLDIRINELMYQQALHFTFYHEMAHLIQKSEFLESNLFENVKPEENFNFNKHVCELDADLFASLSIGSHSLQYAKSIFKENLTEEQLEKILVIICSSALFYILSFQNEDSKIYYKENSHPHPVIRITLIVFSIVSYVLQILKSDNYNFNLNSKDIVNKCLSFSSQISSEMTDKDLIKNYKEIIGKEADNIAKYIMEVQEILNADDSFASNRWNQIAKKLNG